MKPCETLIITLPSCFTQKASCQTPLTTLHPLTLAGASRKKKQQIHLNYLAPCDLSPSTWVRCQIRNLFPFHRGHLCMRTFTMPHETVARRNRFKFLSFKFIFIVFSLFLVATLFAASFVCVFL